MGVPACFHARQPGHLHECAFDTREWTANTVLNFCLDNGVHLTGSSICFTKLPYRGGGGPQRPSATYILIQTNIGGGLYPLRAKAAARSVRRIEPGQALAPQLTMIADMHFRLKACGREATATRCVVAVAFCRCPPSRCSRLMLPTLRQLCLRSGAHFGQRHARPAPAKYPRPTRLPSLRHQVLPVSSTLVHAAK